MDLDVRQLAKFGAVSAFAYLFISQVKQLLGSIKDSAEIEEKEVKSLEEIQPLLKMTGKTRLNIVKLKPYYFQPLHRKVPIRSAEKMRYEPSDSTIARYYTKKLSYPIAETGNLGRIPNQWFASVADDHQPSKYQMIYGFGEIQGDFFQIKKQYEPIKKLSFWTRFRNWISKQVINVLPGSNKVGPIKGAKPIFLGSVVGYLNYEIDLMRDTSILAVCRIEDGKIIPTVTALSKSQILTYFQNRVEKNYLKVAGFLILTIVIGRWLWSDIKALLNSLKAKRQKMMSDYFSPVIDETNEDKACIICYTSCRNMIFFDCRHMIMCRQCFEHYKSDICPYCKLEIDEIKIVNCVKGAK